MIFKDPFEVGVGIETVAADLFNEGVNDGTAPIDFFTTNEHPILHGNFGNRMTFIANRLLFVSRNQP